MFSLLGIAGIAVKSLQTSSDNDTNDINSLILSEIQTQTSTKHLQKCFFGGRSKVNMSFKWDAL